MKELYPDYYSKFKCIANKCPDSCCQDWDVVVDEESESFYNGVKGNFGDKIRSVTVTDEDGDRIFTLNNRRCPFWNKDELCDIYINLGEEHLCETCKKFPRITMEFDGFTEYTLSLACPEAARLILGGDFIIPEWNYNTDENISFLLNARKAVLKIFDEELSFKEKLKKAFSFSKDIQNELSPSSKKNIKPEKGFNKVFHIHERLEYINPAYADKIRKAENFSFTELYDDIYTRLARYYIHRYYLNAVESFDVLSVLKKIFCAYVITSALADNEENPDIVRIIQNYSKEVEHSYDNNAALEFFFDNDEYFDIENLIYVLVASD